MEHDTHVEDNGVTGEDQRWLPVCSCGWTDFPEETRRAAVDATKEHEAGVILTAFRKGRISARMRDSMLASVGYEYAKKGR